MSTKGVSKSLSNLTYYDFKRTLDTKEPTEGENRGFKRSGASLVRYDEKRRCLSYIYMKREVLECGVATRPLSDS